MWSAKALLYLLLPVSVLSVCTDPSTFPNSTATRFHHFTCGTEGQSALPRPHRSLSFRCPFRSPHDAFSDDMDGCEMTKCPVAAGELADKRCLLSFKAPEWNRRATLGAAYCIFSSLVHWRQLSPQLFR
ncbi:hypothetical protein QR680_005292 [Steinernema hermaphroditum]|uniref:Chitin-binding type-2 domain-containing protein n=1 Tax=Steinernema hermaphroditum TaxID=289476 RepID=A0AA39HTP2_9BILA|nr:hypothetical protein QR680_005292 [Steinernema hermaphroditum]